MPVLIVLQALDERQFMRWNSCIVQLLNLIRLCLNSAISVSIGSSNDCCEVGP